MNGAKFLQDRILDLKMLSTYLLGFALDTQKIAAQRSVVPLKPLEAGVLYWSAPFAGPDRQMDDASEAKDHSYGGDRLESLPHDIGHSSLNIGGWPALIASFFAAMA